jgi:PiT family inorganic phosphate transporter
MIPWAIVIVGAILFVAYANGANDTFKGVATLFGSGTTDYRNALWWATATTFLGSVTALILSAKLISVFQGKDLVPAALATSEPFVASVILGAAITVFLASKLGIPISTTHSLTGALSGGGLSAVGLELGFGHLGKNFFLPLLASPLVSIGLVVMAYPLLKFALARLGVTRQSCVCVGDEQWVPVAVSGHGMVTASRAARLRIIIDQETACAERYQGTLFGVGAHTLLDVCHYLSAGTVSFARGLNDTPKIIALGLSLAPVGLSWSIVVVAMVMALGGLLEARKVAETVSQKITAIDHGEGLAANLVTSFLVIVASKWGLPVSTTHVSCGALFGIGALNGQARWNVIRNVVLAWILTLPLAGICAAGIFAVLTRVVWN